VIFGSHFCFISAANFPQETLLFALTNGIHHARIFFTFLFVALIQAAWIIRKEVIGAIFGVFFDHCHPYKIMHTYPGRMLCDRDFSFTGQFHCEMTD